MSGKQPTTLRISVKRKSAAGCWQTHSHLACWCSCVVSRRSSSSSSSGKKVRLSSSRAAEWCHCQVSRGSSALRGQQRPGRLLRATTTAGEEKKRRSNFSSLLSLRAMALQPCRESSTPGTKWKTLPLPSAFPIAMRKPPVALQFWDLPCMPPAQTIHINDSFGVRNDSAARSHSWCIYPDNCESHWTHPAALK